MYLQLAEENTYLSKGNIFKKAFKGIKKIGLSIPRNAYLGMLELNVHGWASKLKKAIDINPSKVKATWEKLGGTYSKLKSAAEHGSKKKHLMDNAGNNYCMAEGGELLSFAPAAAAAAAAPIIAAMAPLLKSILPAKDAEEINAAAEEAAKAGGDVSTSPLDPAHAEKFDTEKGKEGFLSSIPKPVLIGGLALVAFLLLRKKK